MTDQGSVRELLDSGRTTVYWEAEFDANGLSDGEAVKKVYDILVAGMKGIKKVAWRKLRAAKTTTKQPF